MESSACDAAPCAPGPQERTAIVTQPVPCYTQQTPRFGRKPVQARCPNCGALVQTKVKTIYTTSHSDNTLSQSNDLETVYCCYCCTALNCYDCHPGTGVSSGEECIAFLLSFISCCICMTLVPVCIECCENRTPKGFQHSCPCCRTQIATVIVKKRPRT